MNAIYAYEGFPAPGQPFSSSLFFPHLEVVDAEAAFRGDEPTFGWLENVYQLVNQDKTEEAGDLLYDEVFDKDLESLNNVLSLIDFGRLDTFLTVAALSATLPFKAKLSERPGAVVRAQRRLEEIAPKRVEGLLSGLR